MFNLLYDIARIYKTGAALNRSGYYLNLLLFAGQQGLYDRGVSESGSITQVIRIAGGYLGENTAHDLAAAGLGQAIRELDNIRGGNGANDLADMSLEFGFQFNAGGLAGFKGYISINAFALQSVGHGDDGGF